MQLMLLRNWRNWVIAHAQLKRHWSSPFIYFVCFFVFFDRAKQNKTNNKYLSFVCISLYWSQPARDTSLRQADNQLGLRYYSVITVTLKCKNYVETSGILNSWWLKHWKNMSFIQFKILSGICGCGDGGKFLVCRQFLNVLL